MKQILDMKITAIADPVAVLAKNTEVVGSKGSTPVTIDTAGWGMNSFYVRFGAEDCGYDEFEVWECDTSGGAYAKVTGAEFGASGLDALPGTTSDNKTYAIHLATAKCTKRYLQLYLKLADAGANGFQVAWCVQSQPTSGATTKALRGLTGEIIV